MKVFYRATDRIVEYGQDRFYPYIQEHIASVLDKSGCMLNDEYKETVMELYQRYMYAYIIAVKNRDANLLYDLLSMPVCQPLTFDIEGNAATFFDEYSFVALTGTIDEVQLAFEVSLGLFNDEHPTDDVFLGLAGVIESIYPGNLINYHGDNLHNLVLECICENMF